MTIFGKNELQIGALIHRSLGVDLGLYVGSENLAICRLCYNMLNAYNKALKKVNQIVNGIKQKFESNGPLRIKRLSKDSTKALEARVVGEAPVTPFLCGGIPLTFGGIH